MAPVRPAFTVVVLLACLVVSTPLHADVVRITITSRAPAFNGRSFGTAGPYEEIRGLAFGEIDPRDPANAIPAMVTSPPFHLSVRAGTSIRVPVFTMAPSDQPPSCQ